MPVNPDPEPTPLLHELDNAKKTRHQRSQRKKQEDAIKAWVADMKKNEKDI